MSYLLLPLHGAMLVVSLAMLVLKVFVIVDAASRPAAAFPAAGKQTKTFWLIVLVVGLLLWIVGLIAAIVYLVDVRPAVRGVGTRRSGSDGPYGPW